MTNIVEANMSYRDFILAIHDKLDEMRVRGPHNAWLGLKEGKFYFRLTKHALAGKVGSTVDLASFEIFPQFQSRGYFKMTLWALEQYAVSNNIEAVYVENILNPIVDRYLRACDYMEASPGRYPESLFKRVRR